MNSAVWWANMAAKKIKAQEPVARTSGQATARLGQSAIVDILEPLFEAAMRSVIQEVQNSPNRYTLLLLGGGEISVTAPRDIDPHDLTRINQWWALIAEGLMRKGQA
jgi:hypothetical protein